MNASSLPVALPAPHTRSGGRSRSTRPMPQLSVVDRQRRPDAFLRLAILSLGLHALAVAGAWLWPAEPHTTPARPEPITLVALAPITPPSPPVAQPDPAPPPPKPAPPKPATKPTVKPATEPVAKAAVKPVIKPAKPEPVAKPVAPAVSESVAPPPGNRASADPAPAALPGQASAESTESAPVAIDLGAAYRLNPAPKYPPLALRRGWQGTVRLRVALDPDGHPTTVDLATSSGHAVLDEAALAAVRHWRFRPATRLGKPVAATVEVPIVFRISR